MKIYTRTGDDGTTGLFGGARLSKSSPQVEAFGAVDELNACLGVVRSQTPEPSVNEILTQVQAELFVVGAELATVTGKEKTLRMSLVNADAIEELEKAIDRHEEPLAPLTTFILPSGSASGTSLHLARTICRRAERDVLRWGHARSVLVKYLNRLSDLLFVLARYENFKKNQPETPWIPNQG
ncbi:MAG: cob(I)yrinic acid a,c-diamide adenosyltransferase [Polyangiaceae bacterium]|nr:cob(I)yrinic acid a,c-diamide adenosyltransferase [Polyangiaceae bacterium]